MRMAPCGRRRGPGMRPPRKARASIATVAIAIVSLLATVVCSGCLWIAIPSLAYQGYKAEERSHQSGQPKQTSNSQRSSSGDQYE